MRKEALRWWNKLTSAEKHMYSTNARIQGQPRNPETLTGGEIEILYQDKNESDKAIIEMVIANEDLSAKCNNHYSSDDNNQYVSVEISNKTFNIFSIRYNIYTYNGCKSLQDNFKRLSGKKLTRTDSDQTFGEVIEEWKFEKFVTIEVLNHIIKNTCFGCGYVLYSSKCDFCGTEKQQG